jgi:hypothetical protein
MTGSSSKVIAVLFVTVGRRSGMIPGARQPYRLQATDLYVLGRISQHFRVGESQIQAVRLGSPANALFPELRRVRGTPTGDSAGCRPAA